MSGVKAEHKACEECGAQMGDVDLYWFGRRLLCAEDYQIRFSVYPPGARPDEELS